MDKLPKSEKFFDISDYARPLSHWIVQISLNTKLTPIYFTTFALISGILAALMICFDVNKFVVVFLIFLKNLFDAVDGELARARKKPSLVGRYYDSVVDFFTNTILLLSIMLKYDKSFIVFLLALVLMSLQCSVYNFYYVLKRQLANGDKTSRIDEKKLINIYPYDNLYWLKVLHKLYVIIYSWQDDLVSLIDKKALELRNVPNYFMTLTSILALGMQLLIFSILILLDLDFYILEIFIIPYTFMALLIILIRKLFVR